VRSPLVAPMIVAPPDLGTSISVMTTFTWDAVEDAETYALQVSTDPGFGSFVVNKAGLTETSYTLTSPLAYGTTYYWRVGATNEEETGPWVNMKRFTTIPAILSAPVLILPADAATAVSVLPSFRWKVQAGAVSYGLQVSTDPGFATTVVNQTGMTDTTLTLTVRLASSTLYYWHVNATNSTGTSAWTSARSFTTGPASAIEQLDGALPTQYALLQNFPDPFNPTTTIRFEVPKEGFVELKIYDAIGKEVANLLSTYLNAGRYQIRWNAAGNASGVYFYRLVSQDYSAVKKLVLMK
jgi:hypothetical protein